MTTYRVMRIKHTMRNGEQTKQQVDYNEKEFNEFCRVFCGGGYSYKSERRITHMKCTLRSGGYVGAGPSNQYFKLEIIGTSNG